MVSQTIDSAVGLRRHGGTAGTCTQLARRARSFTGRLWFYTVNSPAGWPAGLAPARTRVTASRLDDFGIDHSPPGVNRTLTGRLSSDCTDPRATGGKESGWLESHQRPRGPEPRILLLNYTQRSPRLMAGNHPAAVTPHGGPTRVGQGRPPVNRTLLLGFGDQARPRRRPRIFVRTTGIAPVASWLSPTRSASELRPDRWYHREDSNLSHQHS
jgi:hypothetical protein